MEVDEMSRDGFDDLIKELKRIDEHIAEEIAPEVNELLKESVRFSLVDWYNDYTPQSYERTYNFMKILDGTKTSGNGKTITMSVDSGSMNSYPGFWGNSLQPGTAFDFFFMNGEHGHGRWMMHRSIPPYMSVDADIADGFGGRINKVINNAVNKILK